MQMGIRGAVILQYAFVIATFLLWLCNILYLASSLFGDRFGGLDKLSSSIIDLLPQVLKYLTTIDLSTVTTGLLFYTALRVSGGLRSKLAGKAASETEHKGGFHPEYPFPRGYKTYYVYMGLLGTLFAFIIAFGEAKSAWVSHEIAGENKSIGEGVQAADSIETLLYNADTISIVDTGKYVKSAGDTSYQYLDTNTQANSNGPLDARGDAGLNHDGSPTGNSPDAFTQRTSTRRYDGMTRASDDLFQALGTALWSTFSAILLAYLICPVIERGFSRRRRDDLDHKEDDDPIVDDLDKVAKAFSDLQKNVNDTEKEFGKLQEVITKLGGVQELAKRLATIEERLSKAYAILETQAEDLSQCQNSTKSLESEVDELKSRTSSMSSRVSELEQANLKHEGELHRLTARVSALEERKVLIEKVRGLLSELTKLVKPKSSA